MDRKTINVSFSLEEYGRLIAAKGDRNWHDFIMLLAQPIKPGFSATPKDRKLGE